MTEASSAGTAVSVRDEREACVKLDSQSPKVVMRSRGARYAPDACCKAAAGPVTSADEETLRFITASFPSVWALELLLVLKRGQGACTREDLVERLRGSDAVVSKALDALFAAGLVSMEGDKAFYSPVNRGAEASVDRAEDLYRRRPNAVCRAIVSTRTSGAAAFAAAFKLRGGRGD